MANKDECIRGLIYDTHNPSAYKFNISATSVVHTYTPNVGKIRPSEVEMF